MMITSKLSLAMGEKLGKGAGQGKAGGGERSPFCGV
jgi:hypothetical protein